MADPKRGDSARGRENREPKPAWTQEGKALFRGWIERRWPDAEINNLIEKALKLSEKGPYILQESETHWKKGRVAVECIAEQLPKPNRNQEECEDRVFCLPDRGLFIVNDGIGGSEAGEVASSLLGMLTAAFFAKDKAPEDGPVTSIKRATVATRDLLERYKKINKKDYEQDEFLRIPGTCGATVYIHPEVNEKNGRIKATVGGIGDVEVYRLRPDGSLDTIYRGARIAQIRHLPHEHARMAHGANIVTHYIGGFINPRPQEIQQKFGDLAHKKEAEIVDDTSEGMLSIQEIMLEPGEVLLVATDGLHDNVILRRTDEDWRRNLGHPPQTLEGIVALCKTPDGKLDIQKLNRLLLAATDPSEQRKPDDRGWTLIAPKIK